MRWISSVSGILFRRLESRLNNMYTPIVNTSYCICLVTIIFIGNRRKEQKNESQMYPSLSCSQRSIYFFFSL